MTDPQIMDDGSCTAELENRATGEKRIITFDPLLLLLTCEELEDKHKLPVSESGKRIATVAFVTELCRALHDIGIAGCTPTLAIRLWQSTSDAVTALKKNTSETPSYASGTGSTPPSSPPTPSSASTPTSTG